MKQLLIATHNQAKVIELKEFLADLPLQPASLSDLHITDDVEEDGKTFEENSQKKALFFSKLTGLPAIGDDGGLEIDALNGEPGVRSKRWLGHEATDEELLAHLEKVTKTLPDENRNVQMRLVLTLALPDGKMWSAEGKVRGIIAKKPKMNLLRGFPFRAYFYLPEIEKYYHEGDLTSSERTMYNHRFVAVETLKPIIKRELNLQ